MKSRESRGQESEVTYAASGWLLIIVGLLIAVVGCDWRLAPIPMAGQSVG